MTNEYNSNTQLLKDHDNCSAGDQVGNYLFFQTRKARYIFTANTGQIFLFNLSDMSTSNAGGEICSTDLYNIHQFDAFTPHYICSIQPGYSLEEVQEAVQNDLGHITFGVTYDCNLRCRYCVYSGEFRNYRSHSNIQMDEKVAFKASDYFLQHLSSKKRFVFVTFYGGEPLLNLPLIERIHAYFKNELRERVHFSITTNGTLLNQKAIEFVVKNRIYLSISLDGDRATHDGNRRFANGKPTFDHIIRNLDYLFSTDEEYFNHFVNFNVTITAGCDYKQLDQFFSKYRNAVKVSPVMFYDSESIAPIKGNISNIDYLIEKFIEGCLTHGFEDPKRRWKYLFAFSVLGRGFSMIHNRRVSDKMLFNGTYYLKKHCIPGASKLFVSPDGIFFPCERLDSYLHLQIGNINRGVIVKDVYRLLKEYAVIRNVYCRDCYLIDICDYCFQGASNGVAWDMEKMRFHCQYAREDFKVAFTLYAHILEQDCNALNFLEKE